MQKSMVAWLTSLFLLASCGPTESPESDGGDVERSSPINEDVEETLVLGEDYFNEVKEVNGALQIQNPENITANVNREFLMPSDYVPEDMRAPDVLFSFEGEAERRMLRQEAALALEGLFAAAEDAGHTLYAVSGYRSYDRQAELYEQEVAQRGEEQEVVAMPGQSEHQTGLAMDVSSETVQFGLTEAFGSTPEGGWLDENAHHFGFIIRYPEGKEGITGYDYEPWHLRYVGEIAVDVYENSYTLEEYFEVVKEI
ncbi:M15 family metallopeptidase [Shouchella shacheensis]|uniref:M15 family metallopeptidase n=1 Tax=Shouchella shacheensis TaxID=1649580 RepID=UPI000740514E|nr:M15 family metallopeptidase [Shouchella shacheensis]